MWTKKKDLRIWVLNARSGNNTDLFCVKNFGDDSLLPYLVERATTKSGQMK